MRIPSEKFEVALSFSGKIREFVEKTGEELERLGLKIFYDNNHKNEFNDENVHEYFWNAYSSARSKFCVVFLTKDYLLKKNPRLEQESMRERSIKNLFASNFLIIVSMDENTNGSVLSSTEYVIPVDKTCPEDAAKKIYDEVRNREKTPFFSFGANLAGMLLDRMRTELVDLNAKCEKNTIRVGHGGRSYSMMIRPERQADFSCIEIYERSGEIDSVNSDKMPCSLLFLSEPHNITFKICCIGSADEIIKTNDLSFDEVVDTLSNRLKEGVMKTCH